MDEKDRELLRCLYFVWRGGGSVRIDTRNYDHFRRFVKIGPGDYKKVADYLQKLEEDGYLVTEKSDREKSIVASFTLHGDAEFWMLRSDVGVDEWSGISRSYSATKSR